MCGSWPFRSSSAFRQPLTPFGEEMPLLAIKRRECKTDYKTKKMQRVHAKDSICWRWVFPTLFLLKGRVVGIFRNQPTQKKERKKKRMRSLG